MKVVSEQTDAEVALFHAGEDLRWPLRSLAANIIRVTRGAGRPWEIGKQCADLINAFEQYRAAAGAYPASETIQGILSIDRDAPSYDSEWSHAEEKMIRGGLQVAASRLLGQKPQESAGDREMTEGLAVIQVIRERNRKAAEVNVPHRQPRKRK